MEKQRFIAKVIDWAKEYGLRTQIIDDPAVNARIAVSEQGFPPVQLVNTFDSKVVLFISRLSLSLENQNVLAVMDSRRRSDFLWNLRLSLLLLKVDFNTTPRQPFPTTFEVSQKLFITSTYQEYFEKYKDVKNGVLFIAWLIRQLAESTDEIPVVTGHVDTTQLTDIK
jgi:hypothetical protein